MEKKNGNTFEQLMNEYNTLKYENMRLQELVNKADRLLKIAGFDKVYLSGSFRPSLNNVISAKYQAANFNVSLTKCSEDLGIPYEDLDFITAWGVTTEEYFGILCDFLRPEDELRERWSKNIIADNEYYAELKQRYQEVAEEDKVYKYDGSLNYLKIYTEELDETSYLLGQEYDNCEVGDTITYTHIEENWKGHTDKKCKAVVLETHCTPPYLQS